MPRLKDIDPDLIERIEKFYIKSLNIENLGFWDLVGLSYNYSNRIIKDAIFERQIKIASTLEEIDRIRPENQEPSWRKQQWREKRSEILGIQFDPQKIIDEWDFFSEEYKNKNINLILEVLQKNISDIGKPKIKLIAKFVVKNNDYKDKLFEDLRTKAKSPDDVYLLQELFPADEYREALKEIELREFAKLISDPKVSMSEKIVAINSSSCKELLVAENCGNMIKEAKDISELHAIRRQWGTLLSDADQRELSKQAVRLSNGDVGEILHASDLFIEEDLSVLEGVKKTKREKAMQIIREKDLSFDDLYYIIVQNINYLIAEDLDFAKTKIMEKATNPHQMTRLVDLFPKHETEIVQRVVDTMSMDTILAKSEILNLITNQHNKPLTIFEELCLKKIINILEEQEC